MYQFLKRNANTLPIEAYHICRYHSFYPWHTENAYGHLLVPEDDKIKEVVRVFNVSDLYTKSEVVPDIEELWPYY